MAVCLATGVGALVVVAEAELAVVGYGAELLIRVLPRATAQPGRS